MSSSSLFLHVIGKVSAIKETAENKFSFGVAVDVYDPESKTKKPKLARVDVYAGGKLGETVRGIKKGDLVSGYGEGGVATTKDGGGMLHVQDAWLELVHPEAKRLFTPIVSVAGTLGRDARAVGDGKVGVSIAVNAFDRAKKEKTTVWVDGLCFVGKAQAGLLPFLTSGSLVFAAGEAHVKTYEGKHTLCFSGRHLALLRSRKMDAPVQVDFDEADPFSPPSSSGEGDAYEGEFEDDDIPF